MDESEIIDKVVSLSKACILPPLLIDFDSAPLAADDFQEFRIMAKEQLYLLLDHLYQNQNLLTDQAYDNRLIQLRLNLLRIVCEQHEPNPFFYIDDRALLKSLHKLTTDGDAAFEKAVYQQFLHILKDSLKKSLWKKQLGLIHGCVAFCNDLQRRHPTLMCADGNLMFFLSVGSNLIAHYEPYYKTLGLNLYRHLLRSDTTQLQELNIHSVIYSEIISLIQRSTDLAYNEHLYECLFEIIAMENEKPLNSRWSKYDKVMSELLPQFSIESNGDLCKLLSHQIVKFCCIGNDKIRTKSLKELAEMSAVDHRAHFEKLRQLNSQPNRRAQRWTKKLMNLMTRESMKNMENPKDCAFIINSFHIIYICTIFTMEPASFHSTLGDFTRKLLLVHMKILRAFKGDCDVLSAILEFIKSIEIHQKEDTDLLVALDKIRQHEMLQVSE